MSFLKKLLDLLSARERRQMGVLLVMILLMALLDVVGIASIMPFMALLAQPQILETNSLLAALNAKLGFSDVRHFQFFLGLLVFVALIVSIAFKALTSYAQVRFTLMREYSISMRLIEGYLAQPYAWFLGQHSANLGKTILSEVNRIVGGVMMPAVNIVAQGVVVLAILSLLVAVSPQLAFAVGGFLSGVYGLIYVFSRGYLLRIGQQYFFANEERFKEVVEAFGAIKDIKAGGLETVYAKRFSKPAKTYAEKMAAAQVATQLPRFALEVLAFGGMLLVVLYEISVSGGLAEALPIISLYAFAGYRLMPALQQIYIGVSQLRFSKTSLDVLHADMEKLYPARDSRGGDADLDFSRGVRLKDVCFNYPNSSRLALADINIYIPAHKAIGLVGATGSGKSTAVDVILGLLEPAAGALEVDGVQIAGDDCRRWRRLIGYVPQQIFLIDDSVAANIAFGIDPTCVDRAALEWAARVANLHEFVIKELPQGYETLIGERGVRLSGGQRQRIGVARALYKKPKLLIMDEATSALDNVTEYAVMEAVKNLGHSVTIVMVAHRLTTVRECDCIYLLQDGRVHASGSYDDLIANSEEFKNMARQG